MRSILAVAAIAASTLGIASPAFAGTHRSAFYWDQATCTAYLSGKPFHVVYADSVRAHGYIRRDVGHLAHALHVRHGVRQARVAVYDDCTAGD